MIPQFLQSSFEELCQALKQNNSKQVEKLFVGLEENVGHLDTQLDILKSLSEKTAVESQGRFWILRGSPCSKLSLTNS